MTESGWLDGINESKDMSLSRFRRSWDGQGSLQSMGSKRVGRTEGLK